MRFSAIFFLVGLVAALPAADAAPEAALEE